MSFTLQFVRWIALTCMALASMGVAYAQAPGPMPQIIIMWKQQKLSPHELAAARIRALHERQARFGLSMKPLRTLAIGSEVIRLGRAMSTEEMQRLLADLAKDPAVEYAEMDRLLQQTFIPNDPQFSAQWYSFEATAGLNLSSAWDSSTGAGIRVAILDTGYRPHADLVPNIVGGYDFISDSFIANDGDGRDADPTDPGNATPAGVCAPTAPAISSSWHGTFLAGVIAAVADNGAGIAGTAFGAKIVPVRVFGRCGALLSDVVDAGIWAAGGFVRGVPANPNPAKVINIALAAPAPCDMTSLTAINAIRARGAVVVVAAGNANGDVATTLPASCPNAITVAATTRQGRRAFYSNFGSGVDIAAPGGELLAGPADGVFSTHNSGTTTPGSDTIAVGQGTSLSTAHTSGVLALLMSMHNLTADQAEGLLKSSVRPFPGPCAGCGVGIVDAAAAVNAAANVPLIASLKGGVNVTKSAGFGPAFFSDSTGDIFEYRLRRTKSTGELAEEYRQTSPTFILAPMGCSGEKMVFTLTVVDGAGRTKSYAQTVTFVTDPNGGGLSLACGQ